MLKSPLGEIWIMCHVGLYFIKSQQMIIHKNNKANQYNTASSAKPSIKTKTNKE